MDDNKQYGVHFDKNEYNVRLTGVMRLPSQDAYENELARVQDVLTTHRRLSLDLSEVVFMNSSGIRWLGMLVLEAKGMSATMSIRGNADIAWQAKSLSSFGALYDQLSVKV